MRTPPPGPPFPSNPAEQQAAGSDIEAMIERQTGVTRPAPSEVDVLVQAINAQAATIKAQTATVEALLQSVAMLAGAVAQLLEEEAGTPAPPEEPAKPEPADLDAD